MLDTTNQTSRSPSIGELLSSLVQTFAAAEPQERHQLDEQVRAAITRATRGMSPMAIVSAYLDWLGHLAISPARLASLVKSVLAKSLALGVFAARSLGQHSAQPLASVTEPRLSGAQWQRFPFNVFAQGATLAQDFVNEATSNVRGARPESTALVAFLTSQLLELASPANIPFTNPEVIEATRSSRGQNLKLGLSNLVRDVTRRGPAPRDFEPGVDVAATPGKVVFQNDLIELIQYAPQTARVGAEPLLIVPAWIMKYYILDLAPENSLVRYLCQQGKTVFMISWKNPTRDDANLGMDDYLERGVMAALDAVVAITHSNKVHGIGYCLGGTLLSIAAAAMARDDDNRLKSLTTFASQIDFRDGGEIRLFLGESELAFLEPMMAREGFLDMPSMVNAFKSLRASSQIYGPAVSRYLLGEAAPKNALLSWNADGTRMPERMHREYLRHCYLNNDLAEARYRVDGRTVCVGDISVPTFVLATVTDHVAPWKSVYKAMRLMHTDLTFALTTAGHNAGIVSGPEHPRRRFQVATRHAGDRYIDPDEWRSQTPRQHGSWWPTWDLWLDEQMGGSRKPPPTGAPDKGYPVLRDAPGEYVLD